MLVHCKNPDGVLHIGKHIRIYGRNLGFPPTDISFDLYQKIKDSVDDASYNKQILQRMFGKEFPQIAFTYHEIRFLPDRIIDKLGKLIVGRKKYKSRTFTRHKKIYLIKEKIRDASPS